MRHNPAASFDLGMFAAASGLCEDDIAWYAQASQVYIDQATLDLTTRRFMTALRFEKEFGAWIDAQIEDIVI